MEKEEKLQREKKIGEAEFINKNCWLAKNLNYSPSKRCQYCESRFPNCLFFRYLIVTLILILFILTVSFLIKENISRLVIISIFVLVIVYGYFFSKSTEDIIVANFAQRKAKEALEELTDNLQQKINEQTKNIKEAYDVEKQAHKELKKVDESKTQFMLITQHHLRTPLSINMGFLDLLLTNKFGKVPARIKDVISKVQESTLKEIEIVDDLLNVSQFQLGKEVMQLKLGVDMEFLLEETIKDLSIEAGNKGIYLKIEKSGNIPNISADRIKLKLALTNIIDNAVKYTKQGGIAINLKAENNKLLISVNDTGIGISKNSIPNLFNQTFHRGEQAQRVFAVGKGIGLFLSAKIIEGHKGRIWVESEGEGKGSTFYIELPVV